MICHKCLEKQCDCECAPSGTVIEPGTAQCTITHSDAVVRALRVLDMLGNYVEAGAVEIYFGALMPDDGSSEDITFEDAV